MPTEPDIPFAPGDWVLDRYNPSQTGQYTGRWQMAGQHHVMVQISYPGDGSNYRPLTALQAMDGTSTGSLFQRLRSGHFGRLRDLQRLVT